MDHLIITVGVGEGVAHCINFSIKRNRPHRVYYVLTPESKEKTLPEVRQLNRDSGINLEEEEVLLEEPDNLEKVIEKVNAILERIQSQNHESPFILLDFTSGTKVMSVGAVVSACIRGVENLTYVSGKREKGRVVSGTERIVDQPINFYRIEELKKLLFASFDRYDFSACGIILDDISRRSAESTIQDFVKLWRTIVSFYHRWDLFDHRSLQPKGIRGIPPRNKRFLGYLLDGKHPKSNLYRLVDLFNNAQRRASEGRFDDAVARLYRIIEFIAQIRLQAKGIDSGDVELSKLSPELQKKYQKFQDQEGKVRLPLYRDFELLYDLGDPLGERFFADCKLRDLLQCRNNSILAHGEEAVSEEIYTKMHDQVMGYVLEIIPQVEFKRLSFDALFPEHGEIIRELEKEVS